MKNIVLLLLINLLFYKFGIAQNEHIPFAVAKNYFVKNTYPDRGLHMLKITDQDKFEAIFAPAPLMGKGGKPSQIDFTKSFVIALINEASPKFIDLSVKSLTKKEDSLYLQYKLLSYEKDNTASFRLAVIIIVDNIYMGTVHARSFNVSGEPILGDDLDETGCKPSTGYFWSIINNDCINVSETPYFLEGLTINPALLFNREKDKAEIIGLNFVDARYHSNLLLIRKDDNDWVKGNMELVQVDEDEFVLKEDGHEIARAKVRVK